MIIYRPHRGGLTDSLKESKEFESMDDMKHHIYEHWKKYYLSLGFENAPFDIWDIVIDDERCGWSDIRYVCVKRMGNKIYDCPQCIGMCATDYKRPSG